MKRRKTRKVRRIRRNASLSGPYYVWMTDKFMSGWGPAYGKLNKYVVKCDTLEQAECIFKNAQTREEMKSVNYGRKLPYFSESRYKVSMKTWDQLGYVWKKGCKWQNEDDFYADPRRMSSNRSLRRNEGLGYTSYIPERDESGKWGGSGGGSGKIGDPSNDDPYLGGGIPELLASAEKRLKSLKDKGGGYKAAVLEGQIDVLKSINANPRLGKDEQKALNFARKYPGWHGFAPRKPTANIIRSLAVKGLIEVSDVSNQFRA